MVAVVDVENDEMRMGLVVRLVVWSCISLLYASFYYCADPREDKEDELNVDKRQVSKADIHIGLNSESSSDRQ